MERQVVQVSASRSRGGGGEVRTVWRGSSGRAGAASCRRPAASGKAGTCEGAGYRGHVHTQSDYTRLLPIMPGRAGDGNAYISSLLHSGAGHLKV